MNLYTKSLFALLPVLLFSSKAVYGQSGAANRADTVHYRFGGAPVSIATANLMIASYRKNVGDNATRSLFMDADTLRKYLSNPAISGIKFFLADPKAKAGHAATDATVTLVIAGIDEQFNYIYTENGEVYNEVFPCPPECPPGQAGSDLLPKP